VMRATNRLTVTMSVSFRATLAYGSGQGNVGLREKSRTITFGHQRSLGIFLQTGRSTWAVLQTGHSNAATDRSHQLRPPELRLYSVTSAPC